jgi:hypothetical protein
MLTAVAGAGPELITVANTVAVVPTGTERLDGSTAPTDRSVTEDTSMCPARPPSVIGCPRSRESVRRTGNGADVRPSVEERVVCERESASVRVVTRDQRDSAVDGGVVTTTSRSSESTQVVELCQPIIKCARQSGAVAAMNSYSLPSVHHSLHLGRRGAPRQCPGWCREHRCECGARNRYEARG